MKIKCQWRPYVMKFPFHVVVAIPQDIHLFENSLKKTSKKKEKVSVFSQIT